MFAKLLLIAILIILCLFLIFSDTSSFLKTKHDNMTDVHKFIENKETNKEKLSIQEEINDSYDKLKDRIDKQDNNNLNSLKIWNDNNTLESMITEPCLADTEGVNRLTCFTAPPWWYPMDKYDANKFKSKYYRDSINPIYDYLGNAQEMYWDFKSVTGK